MTSIEDMRRTLLDADLTPHQQKLTLAVWAQLEAGLALNELVASDLMDLCMALQILENVGYLTGASEKGDLLYKWREAERTLPY
jgi:hypothetical protein